jgi:hypothetical protein
MGKSNSSRIKEGEEVKCKVKRMHILSFDIKEIINNELVLAGQTLNSAYYCEILRRLLVNVPNIAPKFGDRRTGRCIVTMCSHTSVITREFSTRINMAVVLHPVYFPDLALCGPSFLLQLDIPQFGHK